MSMMDYIPVMLQDYSVQAVTLLWADFTADLFQSMSRKLADLKRIFRKKFMVYQSFN